MQNAPCPWQGAFSMSFHSLSLNAFTFKIKCGRWRHPLPHSLPFPPPLCPGVLMDGIHGFLCPRLPAGFNHWEKFRGRRISLTSGIFAPSCWQWVAAATFLYLRPCPSSSPGSWASWWPALPHPPAARALWLPACVNPVRTLADTEDTFFCKL